MEVLSGLKVHTQIYQQELSNRSYLRKEEQQPQKRSSPSSPSLYRLLSYGAELQAARPRF